MADARPGPTEEPRPTYMRLWFVGTVVGLAVFLGLLLRGWGTSGDVELDQQGEVVAPAPKVAAESPATPEPGKREDCPGPGAPVELPAAELVRLFMAAATGGGFGSLPATEDVTAQLEATAPSPPVTRMTRARGFVGESGQWSTCVLSTWIGPDGPTESLDVVTVQLVDPNADEDDSADDEADDEDRTTTTSRRSSGRQRWEVTRWLRGTPQPVPRTRAAAVAFYDTDRSCGDPDRPASVAVADGEPAARAVLALEELISGTPGRASTGSSRVPSDIQVLGAEVAGGRARVELTPTTDDLTRCRGTGAYDQVVQTLAGVAAESAGDADVEVEVVIEGDEVSTLRR